MEAQRHEHLAVGVWYTSHSANIHSINRGTVCLLVREIERNVRQRSLEDTWLSLPCVWYKLIIIQNQQVRNGNFFMIIPTTIDYNAHFHTRTISLTECSQWFVYDVNLCGLRLNPRPSNCPLLAFAVLVLVYCAVYLCERECAVILNIIHILLDNPHWYESRAFSANMTFNVLYW